MENLDKLKKRASQLSEKLGRLNKIKENRNRDSIQFGIDYSMTSTNAEDPDFAEFIDKKIKQIEELRAPLVERLKILDELAAEVVNK